MADKRLIRNLFKITGLLIGAAGLIFLLVAAVRIRSEQVCTGVMISFKGSAAGRYVGRAEVARQMWPGGMPALKGRPLEDLDLSLMEQRIEQDPWVRNAELFIDANGRLQVEVEEQQPLARLFNREGASFYIDESMRRIPLNSHFTPNLPVFTGLPVTLTGRSAGDSTWLAQVLEIALAMRVDSLWMAQIEECAYEPPKGFVMYPMAGDHRIIFGGSDRARDKFRNLFVFYAQVLSREGWSHYKSIDLRFDRQVVAIPTVPVKDVADSINAFVTPLTAVPQQEPDPALTNINSNPVKQEPSVNNQTKTPRLVMPSRQRSP
jgi:cell division protein FtsQ